MKLEHLLLGVLLERPSTGYDLKKFMDTHGRFLRSNTQMSQVYRSLATMADRGWVSFIAEDRPGAQDAKIYRVSPEGETVFLDWLTGPYQPPTRYEDPELTARLSFAGFMSVEQVLALLEVEIVARREQVARYRRIDFAPTSPFDRDLANAVGERLHRIGAAATDTHIAAMVALRDDLLDSRLAASDSELDQPTERQPSERQPSERQPSERQEVAR